MNQTLEQFPSGTRVAYDPARGRLWAVCPSCARWSLAPIESRWETLEELERLIRAPGARLLKQGESIALHAVCDLEIIRVGNANLHEESWWRYGAAFSARQRKARATARKGKVIDALVFLMIWGVPYWGHSKADVWLDRARRGSFGKKLWQGESHCTRCGEVLTEIRFDQREALKLRSDDSGYRLALACPRCGDTESGGHNFDGVVADHLLRRTLAYENFSGGTENSVQRAMSQLSRFESPVTLLNDAAVRGLDFGRMPDTTALALEIALNSEVEETLLTAEVAEIESRWKQEEELAAIIDRELTPVQLRLSSSRE